MQVVTHGQVGDDAGQVAVHGAVERIELVCSRQRCMQQRAMFGDANVAADRFQCIHYVSVLFVYRRTIVKRAPQYNGAGRADVIRKPWRVKWPLQITPQRVTACESLRSAPAPGAETLSAICTNWGRWLHSWSRMMTVAAIFPGNILMPQPLPTGTRRWRQAMTPWLSPRRRRAMRQSPPLPCRPARMYLSKNRSRRLRAKRR